MLLVVGRKLEIGDTVSWTAAALYACAPVVGISGTSAYNDAALVCCILATFYFLLVWREEANPMYLAPAGLLAGFCYAIKINALLIPALALLFVLIECRPSPRQSPRQALARCGLLASASLISIAPWMIRRMALTGNPLAPLFNAWFPNAYFLEATERNLAHFMRTYQAFEFRNAPWELQLGGASHGILRP